MCLLDAGGHLSKLCLVLRYFAICHGCDLRKTSLFAEGQLGWPLSVTKTKIEGLRNTGTSANFP